jgi:arylsulfatase A-like enzyme
VGASFYASVTRIYDDGSKVHDDAPVPPQALNNETVLPWRIRSPPLAQVTPEQHLKSAKKKNTETKDNLKDAASSVEHEPKGKVKKISPKTKKPLNILLLYGDDWRHDSIGSASGGLVKTPFFDNLAMQGMRFTHNCVTTSVCWISRATLYTGQYVSRHKSTDPSKPDFYKGWNQTFPYLLRQAGYYFGHVGKWHFKDYAEFIKPQLDWERPYYGRHWWEERGGLIHTTKKNERDAIAFLRERPKDKPFCLTVCFFTPHAQDSSPEQYLPQNESMKLYINDTIPLAPSATNQAWEKMPKFFGEINAGRTRFFKRFDTQEKYQKMMKNYYRLISEIDYSSEQIVKEVESQGALDDTLVIFTTDNGYFHAEHGLAEKFYPHQESIRVPLIVRDPRMAADKVGKLSDDFTLNIDLAPTILGAAGIQTPDVMNGQDISLIYTKGVTGNSWRKEFFYEHPVHLKESVIPASEALVRKDFKYILWPNYDTEQLFDLKNDAYELNDLVHNKDYNGVLQKMRMKFQELKKLAK